MTYVPKRNRRDLARIRAVGLLERAMKARDISGRELARAVGTSAQTVSQLRTGGRLRVRAETARRLERTLRVERGSIFAVEADDRPVEPFIDLIVVA